MIYARIDFQSIARSLLRDIAPWFQYALSLFTFKTKMYGVLAENYEYYVI